MGSLCSKQEASQEASSPGRRLGSAPPAAGKPVSSMPAKVGGPPRTLGSGEPSSARDAAHNDARARAAEAAEARARVAGKGGKLQSQLSAQKKQSRFDAVKSASAQEQRARAADDAARARNWD